jgi:hypothetical protein
MRRFLRRHIRHFIIGGCLVAAAAVGLTIGLVSNGRTKTAASSFSLGEAVVVSGTRQGTAFIATRIAAANGGAAPDRGSSSTTATTAAGL